MLNKMSLLSISRFSTVYHSTLFSEIIISLCAVTIIVYKLYEARFDSLHIYICLIFTAGYTYKLPCRYNANNFGVVLLKDFPEE